MYRNIIFALSFDISVIKDLYNDTGVLNVMYCVPSTQNTLCRGASHCHIWCALCKFCRHCFTLVNAGLSGQLGTGVTVSLCENSLIVLLYQCFPL